MIVSALYLILALLGLGLLVFIHELGHYYAARWVGMRVEVFSIGFGKAVYSWNRDGVKWQVGWLPFGGFVKIAGMESEDGVDPASIRDGFFGASPLSRLIVAIMGPLFNLILAFLMFALIWSSGGREKQFSELTQRIGVIDQNSALFKDGVRSGDLVTKYNDNPVTSAKDHFYAAMTSGDTIVVNGLHYAPNIQAAKPFSYTVPTYQHPYVIESGLLTAGITSSASYLLYSPDTSKANDPLPAGSPMVSSGIMPGDRLFWVDGEQVFSIQQLSGILNDGRVLLTVERQGKHFLSRVQRVEAQELKFDREHKEELTDWRHEAELKQQKIGNLYYIPYNLNDVCVVEGPLAYIDPSLHKIQKSDDLIDAPLQTGDRIVAVDGIPVLRSYELLRQLQSRQVQVIVVRGFDYSQALQWPDVDDAYNKEINWKDLEAIVSSIGTAHPVKSAGNLVLLNPVAPLSRADFPKSPEEFVKYELELKTQRERLEKIEDHEIRDRALQAFDQSAKQLVLGIPNIQDRKVHYNPTPGKLFYDAFKETYSTLIALFSGYLNPKWLSGPIGIVQVIHHNWFVGVKEAIYWMALISLNLGFLNLLPIPVLDGGYICLSLVEMVTGKRVKPKTLEKMVVPFTILLMGLFIFLTFNDVSRVFKLLFG